MAVDVCSEPSTSSSSPRISFSHDLQDSDDIVPIEFQQRCLPAATAADPFLAIDFDFCTAAGHREISSADELFADGKILPIEIKKISSSLPRTPPRISDAAAAADENSRKMLLKEFLSTNPESDDDESSPPARHFWHFRRSSSLNGTGNGLVRSLQFLSRSNSAPTPKPAEPRQASRKQRSKSEPFISRSVSSLLFNTQNHSHLNSSMKNSHPLKKSRSSGHGVRISPVINIVPPNYISKTTFFGLGSLFCNGKSSKKKKRQL